MVKRIRNIENYSLYLNLANPDCVDPLFREEKTRDINIIRETHSI